MTTTDERAEKYRQLVVEYEAIGEKIQALIRQNSGHTKDMSPAEMTAYRQFAAQRDEKYDEIKRIEAEWFSDESGA